MRLILRHTDDVPRPTNQPHRRLISIAILLIATMALGLAYRLQISQPPQLAGLGLDWLYALDLRRSHSHLGFYGVLFPIAWFLWRGTQAWVPNGKWLTLYMWLSGASALVFLLQGYSAAAITLSSLILIYWILFAIRNRSLRGLLKRHWIAPVAPSIALVTVMIGAVAILTRPQPHLANSLARAFLALLLFGVFIPAGLKVISRRPPLSWPWLIASTLAAFDLTEILTTKWAGLGLAWCGLEILRATLAPVSDPSGDASMDRRLQLMWGLLAISFMLLGTSLVPISHFISIAGLHFLILGPLLTTFAFGHLRLQPSVLGRAIYEVGMLVMVSAIALQSVFVEFHKPIQMTAALSGAVVWLTVLVFCVRHFGTNRFSQKGGLQKRDGSQSETSA
ncbi:MAG: hypothetical protein NDI61_12480 [Bdellovibrionaceae bacterium]|nr:hypothetical protein [Pseudobdellovibrionaceae bacterium]